MGMIQVSIQDGLIRVTEDLLYEPLSILLVGCGGTGSEMVDGLVRLHHVLVERGHPGLSLTLIDGDVVSRTNIGRQRFAPTDVGLNKAAVLAQRYGLAFGLEIDRRERMLDSEDFEDLTRADLLITCVDRASVRVAIADFWAGRESETVWLDTGNGEQSGQCVLGHLGRPKGDRLPHVVDLFPALRGTPDDAEPSCSMAEALQAQTLFVNRWMADAANSLLWRLFSKGQSSAHGAFFDMEQVRLSPLRVDPAAWSFLTRTPEPNPELR